MDEAEKKMRAHLARLLPGERHDADLSRRALALRLLAAARVDVAGKSMNGEIVRERSTDYLVSRALAEVGDSVPRVRMTPREAYLARLRGDAAPAAVVAPAAAPDLDARLADLERRVAALETDEQTEDDDPGVAPDGDDADGTDPKTAGPDDSASGTDSPRGAYVKRTRAAGGR